MSVPQWVAILFLIWPRASDGVGNLLHHHVDTGSNAIGPALGEVNPQRGAASASLLQLSSGQSSSAGALRGPRSAGFFHTFAESESTYDAEADHKPPSGWELRPDNPNKGGIKVASYFHESPSGGPKQAFQSHYPAHNPTGAWRVDGGGHWVEDYNYARLDGKAQQKPAEWFDSSVKQFDGLGRPKFPGQEVTELLGTWREHSVNSTMTCATPGCTARSVLQVFDPNITTARNCKFSLHLHPTDFDDQYSGERLVYIEVNGVTVTTDCFPMVSGCNATTQNPMFPCLQELPLDNVMNYSQGLISIAAQISDVVDECPYNGNLLAGVPMVTCMVTDRANLEGPPGGPPPGGPTPTMPLVPGSDLHEVIIREPLRCAERGCIAESDVQMKSGLDFSACNMSVTLYQTDFDNLDGTVEQLEYLAVEGVVVEEGVTPGENPCRSMWGGQKMSLAEVEFPVISGLNVTEHARKGSIRVTAKITPYVDECAHDGYLLNSLVEVRCTLK